MKKARIISGEHKGKIGKVSGFFWGANSCLVSFEDGTEHGFKPCEVDFIDE